MMLLLAVLACRSVPTADEISADQRLRAQRLQLTPGACWVLDGLLFIYDPTECVPGPVFAGFQQADDALADVWAHRDSYDPDAKLAIGTAAQRMGTVWGWAIGSRLQIEALEADPTPDAVARPVGQRPSEDLIIDIH